MKKQSRFEIAGQIECGEKEAVCRIINAIPDGWTAARGSLAASESMLNLGRALSSTQFVFGRHNSQIIAGVDRQEPEIFATLIEGKKPAKVLFGSFESGHCETMRMREVKRLAVYFVQCGYRGILTFKYREPDVEEEDADNWFFGCEISMPDAAKEGKTTITIKSTRDDGHAEVGDTTEPILAACEKLHLSEIQP